jgi:hypothetical protein
MLEMMTRYLVAVDSVHRPKTVIRRGQFEEPASGFTRAQAEQQADAAKKLFFGPRSSERRK